MRIRSTNQRVVGSTPYGSIKTSFFSEYDWIIHRVTSSFIQISYWSSYELVGPFFLFLPHFHVICDLLLNRRKASGIVFVKGKTVAIRGQNWWHTEPRALVQKSLHFVSYLAFDFIEDTIVYFLIFVSVWKHVFLCLIRDHKVTSKRNSASC